MFFYRSNYNYLSLCLSFKNFFRSFLIFNLRSIIIKSGFKLSKPFNLQFNIELSALIELDVDIIASYSDLKGALFF